MNLWMKKLVKQLVILLMIVCALLSLYTWGSLNWVYSSGERAGYVQKFSLKGYACKTWEGELILVTMPGTQAEKFNFTVKNDAIAQKINASLGKRVKISYDEHKGIPSTCFGDSPYFVNDLVSLEQ